MMRAPDSITTPASLLRAAREAATPTAAELGARAHSHGPSPARGISQGELAARYNALLAGDGRLTARHISQIERGVRSLTPAVRVLLEQALTPAVRLRALAGVEEKSTDR